MSNNNTKTAALSAIAIITALALVTLALTQPAFAAPKPKVTICHDPPGEDDPATPEIEGAPHTITIGPKAAAKHLENHDGDTLGECPEVTPT